MRKALDLPLLVTVLALGAISLLTIFAASRALAMNQMAFWVLGLSVLYITANLRYQNWQRLSQPFYAASIAALLAVFVLGESVQGAVRWIDLGLLRFQPSEIAKIATILLLATFFVKRSAKEISSIFASLMLILPVFTLIFLEPDIGSALSIAAIWAGVTFGAGLKIRHFIFIIIVFALSAVLFYQILAPYQKERIATFISPNRDPLGAGYNIIQSKIAVGAGQLLGRGLGRGSQSQLNFLPEAESDFIFAAIAEQLGFLGAGLLIILTVAVLLRISNFATEADRFGQLVLMGALGLLIYQFSVNVGMNMGLIPVTGITFPLVSYGGSSLLSTLLLLGIVFSIRQQQY
ncbi:rod shape-determining protein RodA [Candidatus Curtissbacteria bacterium]|nr:rod shape-determining protein RodA [Candidatus Curtissbacteria bacterium]